MQCFFWRIYAKSGVAKVCTLEIQRNFEFPSGSIFGLRPFQKKNPREKKANFAALRAASKTKDEKTGGKVF